MLSIYLSALETEFERQSFSNLYARIKRKCLYAAFQITKDQSSAEDAVHSAFLKIIEHKEKIFALPCHKQDSYTVITVKNKAIDIVRAIKTTDTIFDEFGEEEIADSCDISGEYERIEGYEQLKAAIKTLPEIYRVVFEMRYLQDLDNGEIAEALDITKVVMSVDDVKRLQNAKFEAVLRLAMIDVFEEEMASMPSDEDIEKMYPFSERHERRMKQLFSHERRLAVFATIRKVSYRTVAVIVITVSLLFFCTSF